MGIVIWLFVKFPGFTPNKTYMTIYVFNPNSMYCLDSEFWVYVRNGYTFLMEYKRKYCEGFAYLPT